jgi:hypothetical protein
VRKSGGTAPRRRRSFASAWPLVYLPTDVYSEFCFNARYPARHGRDLEDPWVIRQLLVYQRFNPLRCTSKWILVQCPDMLKSRLVELAADSLRMPECERLHPTTMHMVVLNYLLKDWRDYINYLEGIVEELVCPVDP